MNPNDQTREAILRYLYDVHRKARGPRSTGKKFRELHKGLQAVGSYKQQEVASNLDYLVQKGWVRENVTKRSFTTPAGTTQDSEQRSYKISDVGIDKLETASVYDRPTGTHVNVTNIRGVTVVGDGNIVNSEFTELPQVLNDLRQLIVDAPDLQDDDKLSAVANIDSLQSQLQLPKQDSSVVTALWTGIESVATAGGFADMVERVAHLLGPILS